MSARFARFGETECSVLTLFVDGVVVPNTLRSSAR
jgi:hypothetical protein